MLPLAQLTGLEVTRPTGRLRPAGGIRFDLIAATLIGWAILGAYLDGWAHHHIAGMESFFTPWHAILYAGFTAMAGFILLALWNNHAAGYPWTRALPPGYELSLLAIPLFAAGGLGDMIWHTLLGIEVSVEALLSPTHLVLAFAGVLLASGPFRAGWRRVATESDGWRSLLPAIFSLAFTLAVFTFFIEYASPFSNPWPAIDRQTNPVEFGQTMGITGIIVQSGVLMSLVLLAVRRWRLPFGSLALVFALGAVPEVFRADQTRFIPAILVAGLIADALHAWLRPSLERRGALRLFAFLTPVVLYALYFLTIQVTSGIGWSVPLWTGAVAIGGIVGLSSSYVLAPSPSSVRLSQTDQQ